MVIEIDSSNEISLTKIAHPGEPIVSINGDLVLCILFLTPSNLLHCDRAMWIPFANDAMNCLTVEVWRFGTSTSLKMVRKTTGCCVACVAEWASDCRASQMYLGLKMLYR
jgi:hypothetical protein